MGRNTLYNFLNSSTRSKTSSERRDYKLYEIKLEVHGYLWFHTVATPTLAGWVHQVAPVIHNYSLILGFLGYPVEESYVNPIDKPSYYTVRKLARERGFYVYPAMITRALTRRVQFIGIGEGHLAIRGKTRLTYPERGFNTILLPGSELKTFILARNDPEIPKYIRVGAKRAGTLKVKSVTSFDYHVENDCDITHPANDHDAEIEDGSRLVLLKHEGGNVVVFARAKKAIVATKGGESENKERVVLACPIKLMGETP